MRSKKLRAKQTMKSPAKSKQDGVARRAAAPASRAVVAADIVGRSSTATRPARRVPAKWRWHYRVLVSVQSRLLQERGELRQVAAEPLEPHSMDEADSATDEFDHDLALSQLSAGQDALYEVNEALKRILNGSYGVCEATGAPIPAARLKAIPWARFTREVEESLEKKGAPARRAGRAWPASAEEAEAAGDAPTTPPADEALSHVFSPLDRHQISKRSTEPAKRKVRNQ
jgi:RNA polymerase-binding transcription factor DksA